MSLVLITPPALEPVSIPQAKAHLRVDTDTVSKAVAGVASGAAGVGSFSAGGDVLAKLIEGEKLRVSGSTGNDGTYTIRAGFSYDAVTDRTEIPVDEAVPDATADGTLTIVDQVETYLGELIAGARANVEETLWRALVTQTWELRWSAFPKGSRPIHVPRPPLQSVASITYTDTAGDARTLVENEDYVVDAGSDPGRIYPAFALSWPVAKFEPESVRVRFVAGYGDAAGDVPDGIRHALKLLIGHWWHVREAASDRTYSAVPLAIDALLAPFRVHDERVLEFV